MLGIEYIRNLYGDTTTTLGEKLGISNVNISHWENGNKPIPSRRISQLSQLYKIPETYFAKELTRLDELEIQNEILLYKYSSEELYDDYILTGKMNELYVEIEFEKMVQDLRELIDKENVKYIARYGEQDINDKRLDNIRLINQFMLVMRNCNQDFLSDVLSAVLLSDPDKKYQPSPVNKELITPLREIMVRWRISDKKSM